MKIVTTNRSDVFNEYIRIISRYNEKNLTKEAAGAKVIKILPETATEAAGAAAPAAGKAVGEAVEIATEELAKAGLKNIDDFKKVIQEVGTLKEKQIKEGFGFLVKEGEAWRYPTQSEADEALASDNFLNSDRSGRVFTLQQNVKQKLSSSGKTNLSNLDKIYIYNVNDNIDIINSSRLINGLGFTEYNKVKYFLELIKKIEADKSKAVVQEKAAKPAGTGTRGKGRGGGRNPAPDTDASPASPGGALAGETGEAAERSAAETAAAAGETAERSAAEAAAAAGETAARPAAEAADTAAEAGEATAEAAASAVKAESSVVEENLTKAIKEGDDTAAESIVPNFDDSLRSILEAQQKALRLSNERTIADISDLRSSLEAAIRTGNQATLDQFLVKITILLESKLGSDTSRYANELKALDDKINNLDRAIASAREIDPKIIERISAISEALKKQAEETRNLIKEFSDLKTQVSSSRAAAVTATSATTAIARAGLLKKSGVILWKASQIAAALGVGYLSYRWYTGLGSDEDDSQGVGGGTNVGEDTRARGGTGDQGRDIGLDAGSSSRDEVIGQYLDDPNQRVILFDKIEVMTPENSNKMLNRIARYYGASGYIKLKTPVVINGETISYVFPRAVRGGRDPIRDVARRAVSEDYFIKVYTEDTENSRRITSRFESAVGSSDPQEIANYGFSTISGGGLFSGKGTFLGFGDRGRRYGKGKENVGVADFGIAGTSRKRMTREERRAVEGMSSISEANDFLSDNGDDYLYDNLEDPMEAFASGQNDYFNKISKNINNSTNKINSYEFAKKADKISNRYFKDAVEDLQDDEFMKAYYAGFSKLHNQKEKKQKPDYEKLYDLHDETGSDLIHKAHPKAISVAEAIGNGGLVENGSERSKAMEDIAFRVPSGNYRARYAFIREALRKKS